MRGGLIKAKKILCPTQNLFGLQAELLLLSHKAEKKKSTTFKTNLISREVWKK